MTGDGGSLRAGDPDATNPDGLGMCTADSPAIPPAVPYLCTRPRRHDGPHAAGDGDVICAVWSNPAPTP